MLPVFPLDISFSPRADQVLGSAAGGAAGPGGGGEGAAPPRRQPSV